MDATFTAVLRLSEQGHSLKKISRSLCISECKTRKILVTLGSYDSPRYRQISQLLKDGKTQDEICELLKLSSSAVNSYIPYSRGMQNAEYPTTNAHRIRACRARKADMNYENHNSR